MVLSLEALRTHHGSKEGHQVDEEADPAGHHLDPEHRPAPVQQLLNLVVVIMEPVGESHHDVKRTQEEDKVEVVIFIDGPFLLIVDYTLSRGGLLLVIILCVVSEAETAASSLIFWLAVPIDSERCGASLSG